MGTYVSYVHKSKGVNALLDGQKIRVYPVLFVHRYWSNLAPVTQARLEHMDRSWGDSGPEFVCNSLEGAQEGDWVYRVRPTFRRYIDSVEFPGEFVGKLTQVGRRWKIRRMTKDEALQEERNTHGLLD